MKVYIKNIKALRALKNLTQEFVATELDIDYSTYGKIESGVTQLTVDRLIKLADIFNVNPSDILGDKQNLLESKSKNNVKIMLEIELSESELANSPLHKAIIKKINSLKDK